MQDPKENQTQEPTPGPDQDGLTIKRVPSHLGPLLIVTFEQSRSTKGVAVASIGVPHDGSFEEIGHDLYLRQVLRQLRTNTEEAHGFDVMPHPDSLYYLDPWPPRFADIHYHTILKFGDGTTNLRDHAAFMLRMAQAHGVKIRIPIDNPAPRVGVSPPLERWFDPVTKEEVFDEKTIRELSDAQIERMRMR